MNVSAQRRGIQYSPQQLALENVANINHNKNLATLSKQRNELLNELLIKLNQNRATINMAMQQANVDYNSALTDYSNNYLNTVMNWTKEDDLTAEERAWEKSQTAEERAWQEAQDKAQKEFELKMQQDQNKWQSSENALDRKKSSKSGGYSYGSGYSYTPYSYSSSYTPYSYSNSLDLEDELDANTLLQTGREDLTDMYNYISNIGGTEELYNKGGAYKNTYDDLISQLQTLEGSEEIQDEIGKAYDTGLEHLYNKSYANSTNTPYLNNGVLITPNNTLNSRTIYDNKKYKDLVEGRYYSEYGRTDEQRKKYQEQVLDALQKDRDVRSGKLNSSKKKSNIHDSFAYKAKTGTLAKKSTSSKKATTKKSSTQTGNHSQTAYVLKSTPNKSTTKKTTTTKKSATKTGNHSQTAYVKKTTTKKSTPKKTTTKKSSTKTGNHSQTAYVKKSTTTKKSTGSFLDNLKKNIKKLFS